MNGILSFRIPQFNNSLSSEYEFIIISIWHKNSLVAHCLFVKIKGQNKQDHKKGKAFDIEKAIHLMNRSNYIN